MANKSAKLAQNQHLAIKLMAVKLNVSFEKMLYSIITAGYEKAQSYDDTKQFIEQFKIFKND